MRFSSSSLLAASLCASLAAQGTITDGNVTYTIVNVPTSCTSVNGLVNFHANGTDTSYQHWYYYCVAGDASACALNSAGSQLTQTYVGDTATLKWANADGRGLAVVWVITLAPISGTSGAALSHIAFTNNTGSPIRLNVYGYLDIDLQNTFANDNARGRVTGAGDMVHDLTDGGGGADTFSVYADQPDLDEVSVFAGTRNKILAQGGGCPVLGPAFAAAGGAFGPGDYTGAFQWQNRPLNPGETLDVWMVLMHNHATFIPCVPPASSVGYCPPTLGTNGAARLSSPLLPVMPMSGALQVSNGLANAAGVMNFGFTQACVNILGINVAMSPITFGVPLGLDANGRACLVVPLDSVTNLSVCGTHAYIQYLFLDPGSVATVPVAATNGVDWTFGR